MGSCGALVVVEAKPSPATDLLLLLDSGHLSGIQLFLMDYLFCIPAHIPCCLLVMQL
jgi:hypothetical protein